MHLCTYACANSCAHAYMLHSKLYHVHAHVEHARIACRLLHTQEAYVARCLAITWLRLERTTFCRVGSPPPVPASGTAAGAPGTSQGATPPPARKPVRSFATRVRTTGDCWDMGPVLRARRRPSAGASRPPACPDVEQDLPSAMLSGRTLLGPEGEKKRGTN